MASIPSSAKTGFWVIIGATVALVVVNIALGYSSRWGGM